MYIVREGANIVALIALKESSIEIRLDKERMFSVVSLEIEYLAVERAQQRKHIGKQILAWVENEIVPTYANSKYITVRAFQDRDIDYSAVPFYESCGFRVIQKPHPMANNVKMAKKIEKGGRFTLIYLFLAICDPIGRAVEMGSRTASRGRPVYPISELKGI